MAKLQSNITGNNSVNWAVPDDFNSDVVEVLDSVEGTYPGREKTSRGITNREVQVISSNEVRVTLTFEDAAARTAYKALDFTAYKAKLHELGWSEPVNTDIDD